MFPQIRFENGLKKLWNPVSKKTLEFMPEERIRLEVIEYLNRKCGFPFSRMSTESPVAFTRGERSLRTDIVVYDKRHQPYLLVECKAPDVKLKPETALQIARYNSVIKAPYLMVTNGDTTFRFKVSEGEVSATDEPVADAGEEKDRDIEYWKDRGIIGTKHPDSAVDAAAELFSTESEIAYMNIPALKGQPDARGYFALFADKSSSWALSLQSCPQNYTWFLAVRFEKGMGTAIFSVNIETRSYLFSEFTYRHNVRPGNINPEDIGKLLNADQNIRLTYLNELYKIVGKQNDGIKS